MINIAAEKNFENKVKAYLTKIGAWFIKYWAGAAYTKEGIPDVLACINGKFYGIEIKADNGKPTLIQLVTLRKIRESGGYGILLYPHDFQGFVNFVRTPSESSSWYYQNIDMQHNWFKKLNA